jgi:uncharacterized protein (TIRG00374 family)
MPTSGRATKAATRAVFLLVSGVSLYLLLPSVLELFTSWQELFELRPLWVVVAVGFEAASFLSTWTLQRIAVGASSWFAIGMSQLAANALGRVLPGGMAVAGALQYRMLGRTTGVPKGRIVSGLTASSALQFGGLVALPILAIPAVATGARVDEGLAQAAWLGASVFVLMLVAGLLVFRFDRPLELLGRIIGWVASLRRSHTRASALPRRLLRERDLIRSAMGGRWKMALTAAVGKWLFDYLALLAALSAVGAEPAPSLVLLAYVAGSLLGMIPLTPGGLGFVEAGLTGMLALAGVGPGAAVVATLAYRLVSFWAPIPVGAAAYWLFRRRYSDRVADSPPAPA